MSQADKSQKKGLVIMAAACVVLLLLGGPAYKLTAGTGHDDTRALAAASGLSDGTYTSELSGSGQETAETSIVKLTISGGKITDCSWDIREADGTMKSQLSKDGQYIMTEDGLLWHEQSEKLGQAVVADNGISALATGEDGKLTDQSSGVSINISEFKAGVENCLKQAAGEPAAE